MILFELFVHASGAQPLNVVRLTCTRSIHREWIQRKLVLRLVTFCDMPESRLLCLSRRLGFAGATERSVVLRVSPLPQFIASCSRSHSIYLVQDVMMRVPPPCSLLLPFYACRRRLLLAQGRRRCIVSKILWIHPTWWCSGSRTNPGRGLWGLEGYLVL